MTEQELRQKLDCSPLLAGCPLAPDSAWERRFPPGQIISDRPNGKSAVGLILAGRVEVYSVAIDGKDVQLNVLKAGECFGVCNLLAGDELDTILRCTEETEVLYVGKDAIYECMKRDAELALRYAELCNKKLQFLIHRIELLTMQSCRGRVIAYLLSRMNENGYVENACSREELASRLGVSRAALFRELASLQSAGALRVESGALFAADRALLENLLYHPGAK